jgi:hypothetical protein
MSTSVIWDELVETVTSRTRTQLLTAKDEAAIHDHRADREEFIRQLVAAAGIDKPDRYLDNVLTYRVDLGHRNAPPLDELDTRAWPDASPGALRNGSGVGGAAASMLSGYVAGETISDI